MSIRLLVEAQDTEVEKLLTYLNSSGIHQQDRAFVLQRALAWLHALEAGTYTLGSTGEDHVYLGGYVAVLPPNSDKHTERHPEELVFPKADKLP
jgi:hypothetical protein